VCGKIEMFSVINICRIEFILLLRVDHIFKWYFILENVKLFNLCIVVTIQLVPQSKLATFKEIVSFFYKWSSSLEKK